MDPITLAIGSAALGAVGSIAEGSANANAAKYNARLSRLSAKQAEEQAAFKAADIAKKTRFGVARTEAAAAANNLEQSGSVTDLIQQQEVTGELDKLLAVYEGRVAATGYRNSALLDDSRAKSARAMGYLGAGQSLLKGGSDIYSMGGF